MTSRPNETDWFFITGLMESLSAGLIAVDRSLQVRVINGRARKILGLPALPAHGMRSLDQALGDHPRLVELIQGAFHRPTLPSRAEMSLHGLGERKIVGYSMTFIKTPDGETVGVSLTFKDLTRIEQLAEQERLRKRMEALGHMASRLAHQIRNPIAAINVMIDLIRRRLADPQVSSETGEFFQRIDHELRSMNSTVTECLEYVRSLPVNQQETDLLPLIREAVDQVLLGAKAGNETVRVENGTVHTRAQLDRNQMKQVFEIIVRNALEATDNAGPVTIRVSGGDRLTDERLHAGDERDSGAEGPERDQTVVVTISDRGTGVDPDSLERIFYPFFTTKKNGSGIGLSVAQKIVDAHGGRIDVDSRVGEGTAFSVVIPRRAPLIAPVT
jgi:signal transduction histidine kinase